MDIQEANSLRWGTFGKSGTEPLRWVTLGECTTEHLRNIKINIIERGKLDDVLKKYVKAVDVIVYSRENVFEEKLFTLEK